MVFPIVEDFRRVIPLEGTPHTLNVWSDRIQAHEDRFRQDRGADPPAIATTWPCRHSFSRLCTVAISRHSPRIDANPRSENCRKPSTCFNWPKIGSIIPFRFAYISRPFLVLNFLAIRCFAESPSGIRPRGA